MRWLWVDRTIADKAVFDTLWWITVVMGRSCFKVASLCRKHCRTYGCWLLLGFVLSQKELVIVMETVTRAE